METSEANKHDLQLKASQEIKITFPKTSETYSQDQEYCVICLDGVSKKIRFHDYDEVYSIPGLYESIFYEHMKCSSPGVVCEMLRRGLESHGTSPSSLSVVEIGAGNGMVGIELQQLGVPKIIGVDILIEAKLAAYRDRPEVYDDYYAIDLTNVPEEIEQSILKERLNTLVSVAALGFDDLPPLAYAKAFNMITEQGWIALNIKDQFFSSDDDSGFDKLLKRMIKEDILTILKKEKYCHRLAIDQTPLNYFAVVGRKNRNIPKSWYDEME